MSSNMKKIYETEKKIFILSFFNLFFLMFVVLLGAYVRATGSGAGCGNHWPLCNGTVIPHSPGIKTLIEYSHRITSALSLPIAFYLLYFIKKQRTYIHSKISLACLWMIFFLLLEAVLGAFLVKFEHVALNTSNYRIISLSLHLINTFCLMAAAASVLYLSKNKSYSFRLKKTKTFILIFLSILFVAESGAITALGDTLFPVKSIEEALIKSQDIGQHILVRLRIYHPFIAIFTSLSLLTFIFQFSGFNCPKTKFFSYLICLCIVMQMAIGALNIKLHAPIFLQIIHLFLAYSLWILFIFFYLVLLETK